MKKRFSAFKLVITITLLAFSISFPNLKKQQTHKNVTAEQLKPLQKKKIKTKEYYDEIVEKGLMLDNLTGGKPPSKSYEKIDYKKDKINNRKILKKFQKPGKFRKLSGTQTLYDLGFIDIYKNSSYALQFIWRNVKKEESKFILYPYKFTYRDKNSQVKNVDNGGVFTLNQTALDNGRFAYIQNISSVQIGKAKGLYDIDIAILSIEHELNGRETDLFKDASTYCEYFVNRVGKLSTCLKGKEGYLEYKQHYPSKGAVVRVSHEDLRNNTLYEDGQLKFKLLIIPDYVTNTEETILDYYIKEGKNVILTFRQLGGHIIAEGKSGYLLEKMGLIPAGTYDNTFTLGSRSSNKDHLIYGCEDIYKDAPDDTIQDQYFKQLICMGYQTRTYLSQAFTIKNLPSDFESLIKYKNTESKKLFKKSEGVEEDITDSNALIDYIVVSKEDASSQKGRIFIVNGNPILNAYYINNIRNMILYAMTKNLIYDLQIKFETANSEEEDLPIPAGEEGIQLVTSMKILNLDEIAITNVEVNILFAKKIVLNSPEGCTKVNDNKYADLNISALDTTYYLKCEINTIPQLNNFAKTFKIELTDYSITAQLYDIPLMYSTITYKENGKEYTPGIFYAQAEPAALLRGTINKDPTSYYPLDGWGLYFDLVLNVENKEKTEAIDVNYVSLIPLIAPLFDGEDEGSVAKVVPLYENYYEKHEYKYPWKKDQPNRGEDYIDYVEVAGKKVCYVDDFDTPVKLARKARDELEEKVTGLYKPEGNATIDEYADKTKASANSLLKQVYYADNEMFYETAAPRVSLFINPITEEAAKALYGDDPIPDDKKDPHNDKRCKVHYAFIRLDTYFYPSDHGQYQLPNGLNHTILISLDHFNQSSITEPKGQSLNDIKKIIVNPGHYDSTKERYNRLKPNEYANSLRELAFMHKYDPTDPAQLAELQSLTTDTIRLTHFMIPFVDKHLVEKAGSIYGFVENPDGSGYFKDYPSIKFVYGHAIPLLLVSSETRLGGRADIKLPSGVDFKDGEDPVKNERVTTSADNVAFYKTTYDRNTRTISVYFKRGLMPNENYGFTSKCKVFIENLNTNKDFQVEITFYDLKFDFSKNDLETLIQGRTEQKTAVHDSFFSFPCLYIENKLQRINPNTNEITTKMYEYELMNPFARYGGYHQELTKHTAVYGSSEAHHVVRPGFQSTSGGFSLLSNIGTSSIPFAEFLEHGKLAVPGVTSTSRLEWNDIWGRKWMQNLRSIFPDIPPVPPAPLSYIMTTTYELITNDNKQERLLEWQSDESVYIRIQMKMRNTYKLYWEPTFCNENKQAFIKERYSDYKNPFFLPFEEDLSAIQDRDDYDVNLGFSSVYGKCYNTDSYIGGKKITEDLLSKMHYMMSCADTVDADTMSACSKNASTWGLPLVKKRPNDITDEEDTSYKHNWNYSPLIESYLPEGYIHSNQMWQLTMESDYWDDSFYKGYPWHLDNCLPNLDNPITKPHDLIAFPIFKGLGYNITYDRNYTLKKFPQYKGWWSDQLQNKDHTLLAGQQKVNEYSVGQESLLQDSDWINAKDLKYPEGKENLATKRLKNIYVCKFNQHRVKVKPSQTKYAFLKNVYQNNVVPVIPDLTEDDVRYNNFDCTGENGYQYSIYNISKIDNRVYTGNDRDWLYFASGLRSNAIEDINVILKMDPIEGTFFEGVTKIQDGGRFTYWQPPDGPNSYQYYDGNVNTVMSKRVDLTLNHKIIPTDLNTFNSYAYQLFTIEDIKEQNREYPFTTYTNSHGYGDATTLVYVGGTDGTSCKVYPGDFTYVKIVFYNNAGFDWIMEERAIPMEGTGVSKPLNGMSIMQGKQTAIQFPKEYKFMSYSIPPEIQPYVTLTPSQHIIDISPQFYDLTFNNVLNIKDALEGDYFYCLNVSETFPDKYKGKLWEIKMTLNKEYFYRLPGHNDPTGIHDYELTIPSIKFGVPIGDGKYKGKVFYNLGQAENITFTYQLHKNFKIKGVKLVNEDIIDSMSEAVSDKKEKFNKLLNIWNGIQNTNKIKISTTSYDNFYQLVTVDLSKEFPLFPYEIPGEPGPFIANFSLLVQTYSENVPFGYSNLLAASRIYYNDTRKLKENDAEYPLYVNCYASGPSILPSYKKKIAEFNETSSVYYESAEQMIYEGDTPFIKLTLTAKNEGTATAYNPIFILGINPDATYKPRKELSSLTIKDEGIVQDYRKIVIQYKGEILSNDYTLFDLYFKMQFGEKKDYTPSSLRQLPEEDKSASFVKSLVVTLCLTQASCREGDQNFGRQNTEKTFKINYTPIQRAVGKIVLNSENIGTETLPKYVLKATIIDYDHSYDISTVEYSFQCKIIGVDDEFREIALIKENTYSDQPFETENNNYKIIYKVIGKFSDGRTLDSLRQNELEFEYALEEPEDEVKIGGFPIYAIIIIIVVVLGVLLTGGFLLYKFFFKKKGDSLEENEEIDVNNNDFENVKTKSTSTRTSISNDKKVIKFESTIK